MLLRQPVGVEGRHPRLHVTGRLRPRPGHLSGELTAGAVRCRDDRGVNLRWARAPRLSVLGTGYLGATHAACMAELGYEVLGVDVDEAKVARLSAGEVPFFEPGLPELLRKHAGRPAGCGSPPPTRRSAEFGDVHFVCVGTPQKKGAYAADLTLRRRGHRRRSRRCLTRPALVVGKSTVPVGTAERLADAGRRAGAAGRRRAGLEPGVPARGLRGRGHPAPRPARLRRRTSDAAEADAARPRLAPILDRPGTPGRGRPTSPPPSWSRSRPTRSSPPRSRSSTRWPRSARSTGADVTQLAEALALRRPDRRPVPARRPRLRRRLPAQGHPRLHGPRRGARRRPGAGVPAGGRRDQHAPPGPRWSTWPASCVGGSFAREAGRRARRRLQAELRRHPRLARAGRRRGRSSSRRGRDRVYDPAGDGQRRRALPGAGATRRRRWRRPRARTWCCT